MWATLPGREWFQKAVDWWTSELRHLGVDVRLGTEATAETVLAESPDAVIVATGSRYSPHGPQRLPEQRARAATTATSSTARGHPPRRRAAEGEGRDPRRRGHPHRRRDRRDPRRATAPRSSSSTSAFAPVSMNLMGTQEVGFIVGRLKAAGVVLVDVDLAALRSASTRHRLRRLHPAGADDRGRRRGRPRAPRASRTTR